MLNTDPAYCSHYCEENIWQLCVDPRVSGADQRVLVISNAARQVAFWHQRASGGGDAPLLWDYHVILASRDERRWLIWDLDTDLGFPEPASRYLARTFRPVASRHAPCFRVLSCADYRRLLNTDRRHMRDARGRFERPPPEWPAIGRGFNLDRIVDMADDFAGEIMGLDELGTDLG